MEPNLRQLKSRAMSLKPSVQIGKKGLTEESIIEIKKQLKKHRLVKVKLLKASLEEKAKKDLAREIAEKTGSRLVGLVGFAASYYKAGEPGKPGKPSKII
jgi:RNA-binding protein